MEAKEKANGQQENGCGILSATSWALNSSGWDYWVRGGEEKGVCDWELGRQWPKPQRKSFPPLHTHWENLCLYFCHPQVPEL